MSATQFGTDREPARSLVRTGPDRRAAIVVVDGFGVGAMPDAGALRPGDVHADTLGALTRWSRGERGRELTVPHLAAAGLADLRPDLHLGAGDGAAGGSVRRAALGYPGADTFAGHQTMMGADMSHVVLRRVAEDLDALRTALAGAGHRVELFEGAKPLLVVDGVALVHDNLEADPGLNWNVSASLDEMTWDDLLAISRIVREVAPVARVIAVGGHSDRPLAASVRLGADGTIGLDTPASGFYRLGGLRVQHLGVDIDHDRQLPQLADSAGLPVTLVGKAADILVARGADARPGVETDQVLADTLAGIARGGLTVANVQQTDLAGHQQDPGRFADLVERVDAALPALVGALGPNGLLVVTGDHGNDPTIGHPFHTREYTPVLAARCRPWDVGPSHDTDGPTSHARPSRGHVRGPLGAGRSTEPIRRLADMESLADIGASVAAWLGLDPGALGNGTALEL